MEAAGGAVCLAEGEGEVAAAAAVQGLAWPHEGWVGCLLKAQQQDWVGWRVARVAWTPEVLAAAAKDGTRLVQGWVAAGSGSAVTVKADSAGVGGGWGEAVVEDWAQEGWELAGWAEAVVEGRGQAGGEQEGWG